MILSGVFQKATFSVCKALLNILSINTVLFSQLLLHCR